MALVRWSALAAADLEEIFDYLGARNLEAARRVIRDLYESAESLGEAPWRGRSGLEEGMLEFIHPRWPYLIAFERHLDHVLVLRVLHTARDRSTN